jgi:2-iminobutanoate/2-iminopropanoate deaminase
MPRTRPMPRTPLMPRIATLALTALLILTACAEPDDDDGPARQVIAPAGQVLEGLPFSPAVRTGDLIFLSGAIGNEPGTRELVSPDVGPQTRQALENLRAVLTAANAGLDDVVKCTVFLLDINDYAAMNEVYASVFGDTPPARSTVAGSGLALGAKVEIECIAVAPEDD